MKRLPIHGPCLESASCISSSWLWSNDDDAHDPRTRTRENRKRYRSETHSRSQSCAIDSACRGPHAEAGEGTLTARLGPNRLYESPRPNSKHHQDHHVFSKYGSKSEIRHGHAQKRTRENATRCQTVGSPSSESYFSSHRRGATTPAERERERARETVVATLIMINNAGGDLDESLTAAEKAREVGLDRS